MPLAYRTGLLQKIPSLGEENLQESCPSAGGGMTVSLQVCEAGVAHAFVEKSGGLIARVVAAWEAGK